MPTYNYKCEDCGHASDVELTFDEVAEKLMLPCTCLGVDGTGVARDTPHKRVYSFGLMPVNGAGGSPGRFGKKFGS